MSRNLKFLFLVKLFYFALTAICFGAIGDGSNSSLSANESPYKNFAENGFALGLSIGARFNLAEDIFTDFEEKNSPCLGGMSRCDSATMGVNKEPCLGGSGCASKASAERESSSSPCLGGSGCASKAMGVHNSNSKDHIFTEIEMFGNQFFSGEIKQNFGTKLSLGYEFQGVRLYGSGGYVISTADYREIQNTKQSVNKGAPFFGVGLGYDITDRTSIRLNSMFYNFDFKPKNSAYKNIKVDVSALTLGFSVHF